MTVEEFRRRGHAMIDWIASYQERVEEFPVLSQAKPGELRAALPTEPPSTPESFDDIMADIDKLILPGITHWQSPNFFAYFPCNASGPAILGELLSAGLNVQGMLWATSPACTELETHVLDWLCQLLGLPPKFNSSSSGGGVIQDSASSASLVALLAARYRSLSILGAPSLDSIVIYTSEHAHSSIERAARIAGIEHVRKVATDDTFAMRADHLAELIEADKLAGRTPSFVCATLGTTSSNAFDPIAAIGEVCTRQNIWLHVDAAMAGTAALCDEFRVGHDGLELADSYTFNPHKWMFTNFDCNCLYIADRSILTRALSTMPEYLRNQATDSGAVIDYRDWQIPLGRRFRALKLWFTLRHYGAEGLRHHIRAHVTSAQWFAKQITAHPQFELAAPAPLNLVCFRHLGGNTRNRELLETLNNSGKMFISHTVLNGKYTLRLCVGQTHTTHAHVEACWNLIQSRGAKS